MSADSNSHSTKVVFSNGSRLFGIPWHIGQMSRDHPQDFSCPHCQARYKIVRIKSDPGAIYQALQCAVCEQRLAPTDGDDILKYFLVSRPRRKKSGGNRAIP
jgi:hypothetical protein